MGKQQIGRRAALAGGMALGTASLVRPRDARAAKGLTVILESEVAIFDPHFTTATITRTFGLHVFDMLFAADSKGEMRPQMIEAWEISSDRLAWAFRLREGLKWHDGTPVTSADCVASLKRWASRDPLGRMLAAATASMETTDARSFKISLKEPFPLMLQVLGKPNAPLPVMMPERFARIPGTTRIDEPVGSGPFRFRKDLWRVGSSMILERFPDYVPRKEPPDFLAGGKKVKIDQLDLRVMPDSSTGANALMAGEMDYMQYLPFDMLPLLEKAPDIKLVGLGGIDQFQGNFRLNHACPPFDNPAVRRVLWKLCDQNAILTAIGVPEQFRTPQCSSFWMCDTPYSTTAGAEGAKISIEAAKAELKAAGYDGTPVIAMEVAGSISQTASRVLIQNMRAAGFVVEQQPRDWPTVLSRRAKKDGWSMFAVYSNGTDMFSPLSHFYIASTCEDYAGWSCDARIPPLLVKFAKADTAEDRKRTAAEVQILAYELTPSVMWGQFTIPAGYRTNLKGLVQSSYPMFWEVDV
jgi:peptide/nickel transport system substrate-binding protein